MAEVKNKSGVRFLVLLLFLVVSGVGINLWSRAGEARVERRALKDFPQTVGSWRQVGADQRFDTETERVLRADDYVARVYTREDGRVAQVSVGYYATQKNGATYHSPLNCLPGAGWAMSEPGKIAVSPTGGARSFEANRYIIQNGSDRQLLVYWYQGRGRAVSSEYWGKIYTVIDSISRRRSDGAMVRVMMPLGAGQSEQSALEAAVNLAAEVSPVLPGFVPD
jgi:EpsI family protein